jgi:hypothetical protein
MRPDKLSVPFCAMTTGAVCNRCSCGDLAGNKTLFLDTLGASAGDGSGALLHPEDQGKTAVMTSVAMMLLIDLLLLISLLQIARVKWRRIVN